MLDGPLFKSSSLCRFIKLFATSCSIFADFFVGRNRSNSLFFDFPSFMANSIKSEKGIVSSSSFFSSYLRKSSVFICEGSLWRNHSIRVCLSSFPCLINRAEMVANFLQYGATSWSFLRDLSLKDSQKASRIHLLVRVFSLVLRPHYLLQGFIVLLNVLSQILDVLAGHAFTVSRDASDSL